MTSRTNSEKGTAADTERDFGLTRRPRYEVKRDFEGREDGQVLVEFAVSLDYMKSARAAKSPLVRSDCVAAARMRRRVAREMNR